MRSTRMLVVLAGVVGAILFANVHVAFAAHTPWHRGACAAVNATVAGGVADLVARGNADVTASFMGFNLVNGPSSYLLRNGLVMGVSAQTYTAANTGCSGGQHFTANPRTIRKGDFGAIKRPGNISPRQVCAPYADGCMRISVRLRKSLPESCWNGTTAYYTVTYWIWIRKTVKAPPPATHKKHAKPASVSYNCTKLATLNQSGQDVVLQVVTVQKGATFVGTSWNMTPTKVIDKKTAQFHVTQTGLVTIVARAVWKIGTKRVVSKNCLTVLSFQPTVTPITSPQCTGTMVNGVCTATTSVVCSGDQTTIRDSNGVAIACQSQTQTTTVVVNNGGGCGCTPTPPPPACKDTVSVTTINDLDAGGNSPNFRVSVTMCGSDTGAMTVLAQYGSVPGGNPPVTVSGQNTYTYTYYAPGEVPPGGQDWVTVTLKDSVTGDVITATTPNFKINPPPPSS